MDNNLEIKKFMAEKIAEGISLSEVQKLVNEKFECKMTYMDVRILASELENIDWSANDPKAQKVEENSDEVVEAELENPPVADGKTVVELNKLIRPGTMASGSVKFASGVTAEWYVDQMGRLGLDKTKGGEPNEEDIKDFQVELKKLFDQ